MRPSSSSWSLRAFDRRTRSPPPAPSGCDPGSRFASLPTPTISPASLAPSNNKPRTSSPLRPPVCAARHLDISRTARARQFGVALFDRRAGTRCYYAQPDRLRGPRLAVSRQPGPFLCAGKVRLKIMDAITVQMLVRKLIRDDRIPEANIKACDVVCGFRCEPDFFNA